MSHQPDLSAMFVLRPTDPKLRRPTVRQTSKLAVTVMRDSGALGVRAADVCHWLSWHQNATGTYPTAVELATWVAHLSRQEPPETARGRFARLDATAQRNYVSKGLWDAGRAVMVEAVPQGDRVCSVNRRKACVWRLRAL